MLEAIFFTILGGLVLALIIWKAFRPLLIILAIVLVIFFIVKLFKN